ncbi:MAG: hypothetical protein ABR559_04940 [Gemmatimonadota bacterium]
MRGFLTIGLLVACVTASVTAPAAAQDVPGGLAAWLGWDAGDQLVYATGDDERLCVEVGAPRRVDGRLYAPLKGMPWPGLASDSQVLLPLDGALAVWLIPTPGPRPHARAFIDAPQQLLRQGASLLPADGWFVTRGTLARPEALLYVRCAACLDAGLRVRFERGRGITLIESTTLTGTESLRLDDSSDTAATCRDG